MGNKADFFNKLRKYLGKLPKQEQTELLADYEEHFEFAKLDGRSEQEIIKGLGDPAKLGREHVMDYYLSQADQLRSYRSLAQTVFSTIGTGLVNLVLILIPFLAATVVLATLFVTAIILTLLPLSMVSIGYAAVDMSLKLFLLCLTLVGSGCGMLLFAASIKLTRTFTNRFIPYLQRKTQQLRGDKK